MPKQSKPKIHTEKYINYEVHFGPKPMKEREVLKNIINKRNHAIIITCSANSNLTINCKKLFYNTLPLFFMF